MSLTEFIFRFSFFIILSYLKIYFLAEFEMKRKRQKSSKKDKENYLNLKCSLKYKSFLEDDYTFFVTIYSFYSNINKNALKHTS